MTGPFANYGSKLIQQGYGVVPIPKGGKSPAIKDFAWQKDYAKSQADLKDMLDRGWGRHGIGIVTKDTPAIDIDVLDAAVVAHMVEWVSTHIGVAPQRIGKAPKTLLLFACDEPFSKIYSNSYRVEAHPEWTPEKHWMRIEVLGDGQQFVAFHTHPDTNKPYLWVDPVETPETTSVLDLITLSAEQAQAVCREFERYVESLGWIKMNSAGAASNASDVDFDALALESPPEETEDEVTRVKAALDATRPHISEWDYEQWLAVMFALKWTQWDCSEELARSWSESSDKHTDEHFDRTWRGAEKKQSMKKVTLATVYQAAKEVGWDASRAKSEEQEQEDLEKLLGMVEALKGLTGSPQSRARTKILKEMSGMDMVAGNEEMVLNGIKTITKLTMAVLRREYKTVKSKIAETGEKATHAGYANRMFKTLQEQSGAKPVGVEGQIFNYDPNQRIWQGKLPSEFSTMVADELDGLENCNRRSDYTAIASHLYDIVAPGREAFFSDAPQGMACDGRFYKVSKEGKIERLKLAAEHRQRVLFPHRPQAGELTMFEKLLSETFSDDKAQVDLLQEIFGSVLMGIMAKYEKVVLFKGPGRSGKGTMLKIISAMMPEGAVTAVTPFKWANEYYLANLAGKRLNVVGELPDDEPIPANHFKTVTGRDIIAGRHPTGRPFQFRNEAAHVFNMNGFVYTKDHSDTFYTRWIMLEFPNSRIGKDSSIDADLAKKIIASELPAIMEWAMRGAVRLLERGYFQLTDTHARMLTQWQRRTSTLLEFLYDKDACVLDSSVPANDCPLRSVFYKAYTDWCRSTNRKPLGKQRLYDELDMPGVAKMGLRMGCRSNGADVVRGVRLRGADFDAFSAETDAFSPPPDDDPL